MIINSTQKLIDELYAAVMDGQPFSQVIAHSQAYAMDLRRRVALEFTERGFVIDRSKSKSNQLSVRGVLIQFDCVDHVVRSQRLDGLRGVWGVFVDHFVYERGPEFFIQNKKLDAYINDLQEFHQQIQGLPWVPEEKTE